MIAVVDLGVLKSDATLPPPSSRSPFAPHQEATEAGYGELANTVSKVSSRSPSASKFTLHLISAQLHKIQPVVGGAG